jgi:hypothetical protein
MRNTDIIVTVVIRTTSNEEISEIDSQAFMYIQYIKCYGGILRQKSSTKPKAISK